ncbi:unnamed protein product [Effrenium voratum]|nr:unnamed protein product [Effrenium voratum]
MKGFGFLLSEELQALGYVQDIFLGQMHAPQNCQAGLAVSFTAFLNERNQPQAKDLADVENWQFDAELQRRVSHIELPSKQIDADTAALIAAVLHKFSRLHTLNLSKNDIRDEGARVLAVHMRCMPELRQAIRHLDLSGNAITAAGACEIAREFLQRQGEDLNAADCAPILDLSDNPLEDLGVQVGTSHNVASYIQRSVRLRLRNVGLKKDGLLALLKQKQWIVELNVELNPIGNATSGVGAESTNLGTQLASPEAQIVVPGQWPICGAMLVPYNECLSNATGLKDLDCSGNGLGDTGAKEMVKAMKCTDGLERLALNDSGCYILTATMLQAALGANAGSQADDGVLSGLVNLAVLRALELRGGA